jgi:hypothetical protein
VAFSVIENWSERRLSPDFSPAVMFLLSVRLTYVLNCGLYLSVSHCTECFGSKYKKSDGEFYGLCSKPKQNGHTECPGRKCQDFII